MDKSKTCLILAHTTEHALIGLPKPLFEYGKYGLSHGADPANSGTVLAFERSELTPVKVKL